jgi:hypothetical protein
MKNVLDKFVQKTEKSILCSITFFPRKSAVYEIMWKNTVERERLRMTIWRMSTACWENKVTNTPSQYVILIAFPL